METEGDFCRHSLIYYANVYPFLIYLIRKLLWFNEKNLDKDRWYFKSIWNLSSESSQPFSNMMYFTNTITTFRLFLLLVLTVCFISALISTCLIVFATVSFINIGLLPDTGKVFRFFNNLQHFSSSNVFAWIIWHANCIFYRESKN